MLCYIFNQKLHHWKFHIRTCLGVPHFDIAIIAAAQEFCSIIIEADISDSFCMTQESPK